MPRQQVIDILKGCVESQGYAFGQGFKQWINRLVAQMPSAWLEPVAIAALSGQKEITLRYKVTMNLMHHAPDATPEQKEALWMEMESHAIAITTHLNQNPLIAQVVAMQGTPMEYSLTNRGEIAYKIELQIELIECNKHNCNDNN